MACGDTGDVNVLSRVGFSNHLPPQPPATATSLLTFADMVLALDNKGFTNDSITVTDSTHREKNLKDDHTYASNKSHKMTTRSQASRINSQCPTTTVYDKPRHLEQFDTRNDRTGECFSNSNPAEGSNINCDSLHVTFSHHGPCHSYCLHKYRTAAPNTNNADDVKMYQEMDRKVKRSSSVENITTESIAADSFSEWPGTSRRNSPRKSCSFEEVNRNTGSHKSDDRRKGGSSGQLHRLVNDTLEFPCWPRKADHTYATATWDGTAASHSLFEQELNQEDMKTEDLDMEVTEYVLPLRKKNLNSQFDEPQKNALAFHNQVYQKDDHTYVKQNADFSVNSLSPFASDSIIRKSGYSCSTFPRQKCREDHTYFSSGLTKHGSSSSCGKDWNSVHTVTNVSQNKERTDLSSRHGAPQVFSAKKDHNYSTSA